MEKGWMEIFLELTKIPHCSGETEALRNYLADFTRKHGYRVEIDGAGNVMAYGKKSALTLQSHYDMVCIGRAPRIETVIEKGWMRAVESSLGADNGMGVAMMLHLVRKGVNADFLFTNDEEIGLIGAGALELEIRTPCLLNLDSEELGKVYIGCAGGEDIHCRAEIRRVETPEKGGWYTLTAEAPGGHSGVNIAEAIPNAITELASVMVANSRMKIGTIEGGERINAIPRHAKASVWMPEGKEPLSRNPRVRIERCENPELPTVVEGRDVARALFGFAHGVRAWNRELDLPQSSVNLAEVSLKEKEVRIALSARSMANEDLERLVAQNVAGWEALGFECRTEGKYPAWEPEINAFGERVLEHYRKVDPEASYAAIHAGLECALFADRFPHLQIVSIGPTILDPHSDRERVDLESVEKVMNVVEAVIADLSSI
ncbi:M20/M25/M40 family metallo-hydrolase [Hydrogenimonas sp.]